MFYTFCAYSTVKIKYYKLNQIPIMKLKPLIINLNVKHKPVIINFEHYQPVDLT